MRKLRVLQKEKQTEKQTEKRNEQQNSNNSDNNPEISPNENYSLKEDTTNRDIIHVTYIFVGLLVLVLGYFTHFMVKESNEVINSSYNQRQDLLAEQVVRGDIISADGEVLAHTVTNENGTETRVYPYGNMFAHIVGRFLKGRTGIESYDNFYLLTSNSNPIKKVFNELSGKKNMGDNVITTLDTSLQEAAYDALGNHKGAVVVLEPSSGKILAMVSKPDYDPNNISEIWDELTEDSDNNSALINRATQGVYPPGSIFKILTALEYIRENPDYENYAYDCDGQDVINDIVINCYNNKAHGNEDLIKSFAKSCNSSFAQLGTTLNMTAFRKLCNSFLFNTALPTNLVYNQSSFVLNANSDIEDIPQTVIGQGKTQITPFHSALIVSAIANGGVLMKPYVVDSLENNNGVTVKKYLPEIYDTLMTPSESDILTTLMAEVVTNGTASALSGKNYTSAGKTGSAEFDEDKPAHAWFVGFAPVEEPEIVVSIIVEGVGTGSDYAVPIASKIYDTYFNE